MDSAQHRIKHHFPRSTQYDPTWVREHSMGENVLFNLESITSLLPLKKGLRVLDLGCGKAASSIFLAQEYEVQVWAVDEAISATANYKRVLDEGLENQVFPLQANARSLPFPEEFFDVVLVIDSYTYFGTDDKYLPYICHFIKPEGYIGIVDVCFKEEIETIDQVPDFLREDFQEYWYYIHSVAWWRKLWEKTGLVHITEASLLPAADLIREHYVKDFEEHGQKKDPFARALKKDNQQTISFFRMIGQRTSKEAYLQSYKKA
ncbi:cyclopropane-fatty-acyl-phospholipid synthase family protein [Rufibacter sp. LB8]|uniref:SAM-dependent methyltransferase n=1 Tax=Rufibacter sp. LB8 TaxID=2777781 RepID=UPI00178C457A|nr:class I SAM-dependent methyltransferase [Rufibacter sp. LB8]